MKWLVPFLSVFFLPATGIAAQDGSAFMVAYAPATGASSPAAEAAAAPQIVQDDAVKGGWDLGFAYAFVRFPSIEFTATTGGLNATVSYYVRDHLAVEDSLTSTIGSQSASRYDAKYLFYGAGLKRSLGNGKLRPYVHGLVGGVHMYPQTAFSPNGFAVELGGGMERRIRGQVWLQFGADYVRSQLYHSGQNNLQVVMGVLFRLGPHN